ncbi:hypothetical protein HUJ05_004423, partial [Dendroctonus ponderosae]
MHLLPDSFSEMAQKGMDPMVNSISILLDKRRPAEGHLAMTKEAFVKRLGIQIGIVHFRSLAAFNQPARFFHSLFDLPVTLHQPDQAAEVKYFENAFLKVNKDEEIAFLDVLLNEDESGHYKQICDALSTGFSLILDFAWSGTEVAQDLTSNMSLPYLHVDVSVAPFLVLLDSYLDSRNSTDVVVVFDKEEYIDQSLYYWLDSVRLRLVMADALNRSTASKIESIRPIPHSFAIVASAKNMNKLVSQALNEDLMSLSDRWNLVFTDFETGIFDKSLFQNQTPSLMYLKPELCLDLSIQSRCPSNFVLNEQFLYWLAWGLSRLAKMAAEESLEFPEKEFQCGKTTFSEDTKERLGDMLDSIIADNSNVLSLTGRSVKVSVRGNVEKMINGSFQTIAQYTNGKLTPEPGKQIDPIRAFYRIGITHAIPWSFKVQNPQTGEFYWTGYCADFAQKISEVMNFDYVFVEPATGTFGEKVNGTWDGIVGDLAVGETDIAITAVIMTADKEEVIDFVAPYYEQTGITIVMRKPVRKTSLFKFMTVLKLEVWLSIVGALIVTGFMIWFLDKYSPY